MASNSHIEWTDASWNCLAGCEAVSPGCAHCYASTMTRRLEAMGQKDYAGLTTAKHFNGTVRCLPDKLDIPLRWRKPRMVFVNSMSDLFHEDVPDEFIDQVFAVMALCPQHTFQVLTKRAERMAAFLGRIETRIDAVASAILGRIRPAAIPYGTAVGDAVGEYYNRRPAMPLPNVWLGISCEEQQRADERIPWLLRTPAAVRFISAEPLLGPVDLLGVDTVASKSMGEDSTLFPADKIGWVICGGESGAGARPCDVSWIRSIVQQCREAEVAIFVKQLGSNPFDPSLPEARCRCPQWTESCESEDHPRGFLELIDRKGGDPAEWSEDLRVRQFPVQESVDG